MNTEVSQVPVSRVEPHVSSQINTSLEPVLGGDDVDQFKHSALFIICSARLL